MRQGLPGSVESAINANRDPRFRKISGVSAARVGSGAKIAYRKLCVRRITMRFNKHEHTSSFGLVLQMHVGLYWYRCHILAIRYYNRTHPGIVNREAYPGKKKPTQVVH